MPLYFQKYSVLTKFILLLINAIIFIKNVWFNLLSVKTGSSIYHVICLLYMYFRIGISK